MSGAALLEIERGEPLGRIIYSSTEDGSLIRTIGTFDEGVFPESGLLASSNTHAYVASGSVPEIGTEELVIKVKDDGSEEPVIDIVARSRESGEPVDPGVYPELLVSGLKLAMDEQGVQTAKLGEDSVPLPEEVAETFQLQEDEAGAHIVRPPTRYVPSSVW